jgi:hypothetical protein
MTKAAVTNFLLLVIAVALIAIAVKPYLDPLPAQAQTTLAYPFYIEPGVQMLRAPDGRTQVYGKVVVACATEGSGASRPGRRIHILPIR